MNIVNMPLNGNQTSGRPYGVQTIVVHHMAGIATALGCRNTLQNRGVSAHYGIGSDGVIGKYVEEGNRAWHSGDGINVGSRGNDKGVGIEVANSGIGGDWPINDTSWALLIELVRDIAARNGLLPLRVGVNLFGHRDLSATACPGNYLYARLQQLADTVNGSAPAPTPAPAPGKKTVDEVAREVIQGAWGNGSDRQARLTAAGYDYNAVQSKVNEILGGNGGAVPQTDLEAMANAVIRGEYGNGDARKAALGSNYDAVQAIVNDKLGAGSSANVVNDSIITAVIRGDFGNGADRKARLESAGYDYNEVQAAVNARLLG